MNSVAVALLAFSGGLVVSAGLFALLTTIRVANRMLHFTKTRDNLYLVEEIMAIGAIVGNVIFVFDVHTGLGLFAGSVYAIFAGAFSGCVVIALAEVIKAIPIFVRRVRISTGLGYVVVALAVGKVLGSLLDAFILTG